jgi:alpha-ketoglutarate-dependent taurine dioxygenase
MDLERAIASGSLSEAQHLREEVRAIHATFVDGYPGFAVVDGLSSLPQSSWARAIELLSRAVGDLLVQDAEGTLVRNVRDRGTRIGEGATSRYSDSRYGGSYHTDGAELPMPPPDSFALMCVRKAMTGGGLRLLHAAAVFERVEERSREAAACLLLPFHFDRRGARGPDGSPTVEKPIFFDVDGELGVTYLREYVLAGHLHPGVAPLSDAQRRALAILDEVMEDESLIVEGSLEPGQVFLGDNTRLLHGRTEFVDPPTPAEARLLYRTWIRVA